MLRGKGGMGNGDQYEMPQMRQCMGSIVERDKQTWVPVFNPFWRVVFCVADGPVDGRPADFCDV